MHERNQPSSGVTGHWRKDMTNNAQAIAAPQTKSATTTIAILFAAIVGFGIISVAGHVQADTLHTAAHDVRHATGFPCH